PARDRSPDHLRLQTRSTHIRVTGPCWVVCRHLNQLKPFLGFDLKQQNMICVGKSGNVVLIRRKSWEPLAWTSGISNCESHVVQVVLLTGAGSFHKNRKGGPGKAALFSIFVSEGVRRLYVLGLPALGPLHYVELDLLAFLQAAESIRLDRREVNENVLAILAADETISFCVVKPLYCSCFHGVAYVPLFCNVA